MTRRKMQMVYSRILALGLNEGCPDRLDVAGKINSSNQFGKG